MKKISLLFVVLSLRLVIHSQPGALDYSFGTSGKVITDFGSTNDWGTSLVIQNDGKVIVGGFSGTSGPSADFALARYNFNGSLDSTFGSFGKVITDIDSSWQESWGIAIQQDGKIVIAGNSAKNSPWDFALVRYNTNGTLDSSFGGDGSVTADFGNSHDLVTSIAIQPDGKILLAGYRCYGHCDFALARFNTDGSVDTTFGGNGKVITDFGGEYDRSWSMAIQNDGKIILGGGTNVAGTNDYDFALARYTINGTLDTSFGIGGKVVTDFGNLHGYCYSVLVLSNGQILAAGTSNSDFALVRYNSDGTLDNSFGINGKVVTDLGNVNDIAFALALQSDGKIILAGSSGLPSSFALVRYHSSGTLDSTFDFDGKVITNLGTNSRAFSAGITYDDRIVVAGFSDQDFAIARYLGCTDLSMPTKHCGYNTVDAPENFSTENIVIFPNPSDGIFNIELRDRVDFSEANIYNAFGNCVWKSGTLSNSFIEIDFREYSTGIYFVEVISEGRRSMSKLIFN